MIHQSLISSRSSCLQTKQLCTPFKPEQSGACRYGADTFPHSTETQLASVMLTDGGDAGGAAVFFVELPNAG
jgi:hypothetical protein